MPQTAKTATMKKLLLLLAALFAISAGGICCSGSGDDPGEQEKPVDPPPSPDDGVDWSKIDPKATVRGVVTCASAAVQGVVVTDGVNMTRTNKQGAYGLRTSSDKSKLVYLTVPSGYEVESTRGFIPRFYRRVTAPTSVEQVQRHDFTLKKVNNDRHIMIVSADMHIRNRAMILQIPMKRNQFSGKHFSLPFMVKISKTQVGRYTGRIPPMMNSLSICEIPLPARRIPQKRPLVNLSGH